MRRGVDQESRKPCTALAQARTNVAAGHEFEQARSPCYTENAAATTLIQQLQQSLLKVSNFLAAQHVVGSDDGRRGGNDTTAASKRSDEAVTENAARTL